MEKAAPFVKAIILSALVCTMGEAAAQAITGKVRTEEGGALSGVIVSILHREDSIIHSFGRTDVSGGFSLPAPADTGAYLLVFLYPRRTDVAIPLDVPHGFRGSELGDVRLPLNTVFLEEIVVTAGGLMTVRGDTIEYDIGRLELAPNSRVADVINQLPGMQITRGGQIFSHGKMVDRVLVDGEPFFGNDPSLVAKNIRSDMVDKVQVYDGASDREKMTGIKDSDKRTTIDIKLKEDKKKGVFGMAQGGYLNGFYNNVAMLNRFNGSEKIFGYGILSNTGKLGIGYKNMTTGGGGSVDGFDRGSGNFTGEGRPSVYSSGLGYSNAWEKRRLNASLSAKGMRVEGEGDEYQVINSGARTRKNTRSTGFDRTSRGQDFALDHEMNGRSRLYVSLRAGHERVLETSRKDSRMEEVGRSGAIGTLKQENEGKENVFRANMDINWSTDLKKEDRRISVGFRPDMLTAIADKCYAKTVGNGQDTPTTNALKTTGNRHENNMDFGLAYSEPVHKGILVNSYESKNYRSHNRSHATGGEEDDAQMFGGDFRYKYTVNRISSVYRATVKGLAAELGTALSLERSDQKDISTGSRVRNRFLFLQPVAELEYRWHQNHTINGRYSKTNVAPTSFLVQPFGEADDLQNVYIGNNGLKPRSANRFSLDYHNFKLRKMRAINASFELNLKHRDIGHAILTDGTQNVIRPVNIDKPTYDYRIGAAFGREVASKNDYLSLQLEGRQSLGYNYVDGIENSLRGLSAKFRPNLSVRERGGFRFNIGAGPVFESLRHSQNDDLNVKGLGFEGQGSLYLRFPLRFRLEQHFDYAHKPRSGLPGTSLDRLLWDVTLAKHFGKADMFTAELSANDLLDQNTTLQRIHGSTGFIESRHATVNRHFLLSFKWEINKMGN